MCSVQSCVHTRSVLCLDGKGMLASEDHCGDAISKLRHYEACTGGQVLLLSLSFSLRPLFLIVFFVCYRSAPHQCRKEPTMQPTHTPLSHLDRAPAPGRPAPKPTEKPKNSNVRAIRSLQSLMFFSLRGLLK